MDDEAFSGAITVALGEGGAILLAGRMSDDGNIVGDFFDVVPPGQRYGLLSYAALREMATTTGQIMAGDLFGPEAT